MTEHLEEVTVEVVREGKDYERPVDLTPYNDSIKLFDVEEDMSVECAGWICTGKTIGMQIIVVNEHSAMVSSASGFVRLDLVDDVEEQMRRTEESLAHQFEQRLAASQQIVQQPGSRIIT